MGRKPHIIRSYPDEILLEEVRRVARFVDKPVLTGDDFTRLSGIMASTLTRRFGKWREVLKRAGVGHMYSGEADPKWRSNYPDEVLIEELRRVAEILDKPTLTRDDFRRNSNINPATPAHRFGGWQTALKRAGLGDRYYYAVEGAVNLAHTRYSDEWLLDEVRRVARLVGKPILTTTDFCKHSKVRFNTVKLRFGSWEDALKLVGLADMHYGSNTEAARLHRLKLTDDELLAEVRRVADIVKMPVLKRVDFFAHSRFSKSVYRQRFGGWPNVLKLAGLGDILSPAKRYMHPFGYGFSNEMMLEELRRVAGLVDKPLLSTTDFNRLARISSSTVGKRFGGWANALNAAGFGHMYAGVDENGFSHYPRKVYTDEMLLEEVRRVAALVNKPVMRTTDFTAHSRFNVSNIGKRFGGWRGALERAGLSHMFSEESGYSDETLLEEVRRVAQLVEKPTLTRQDFRTLSRISDMTVMKRFGSWSNALHWAGVGHMCSWRSVVGSRSQTMSRRCADRLTSRGGCHLEPCAEPT